MSESPFFITGTQRSGTTLLFQILNSHPRLAVLNEFWDVYPYLSGEETDSAAFVRLLAERFGLQASTVAPLVDAATGAFDAFAQTMQAMAATAGKSRWGFKDPHLTYYLEAFRDRYPGARFVILIRDARGVINSYLSRKWNVANVYYGARLWKEEVGLQLAFAERYPQEALILRFEELLAEPERWIAEVCGFLSESYSDNLLEFHRAPVKINLHQGNINITKPIQQKMAEKWRSQMSSRQIGVIESIAGSELHRLGYPLTGATATLTSLHRFGYSLHQSLMTNFWWQRRTGWRGLRRRLGLPVDEVGNKVKASLDPAAQPSDRRHG